jgi:hypothetical protein
MSMTLRIAVPLKGLPIGCAAAITRAPIAPGQRVQGIGQKKAVRAQTTVAARLLFDAVMFLRATRIASNAKTLVSASSPPW